MCLHGLRTLFSRYFDRIRPDTNVGLILEFVSGILRLSTKYYIEPLRKKCIDILKRKIPTSSLTDMDAIFGTQVHRRVRYAEFSVDIRFSIVNLARETRVLELLPFMFYLCARLHTNVVLNGTSVAVLSWKDKAICLAGRGKLLRAQRTLSYAPFIDIKPSASCKNHPTLCASMIPRTIQTELERLAFIDIFSLECCKRTIMASHVCAPCVKHAMLQHQEGRKQVWDMLPGIFQLGSWENIRDTQNK